MGSVCAAALMKKDLALPIGKINNKTDRGLQNINVQVFYFHSLILKIPTLELKDSTFSDGKKNNKEIELKKIKHKI